MRTPSTTVTPLLAALLTAALLLAALIGASPDRQLVAADTATAAPVMWTDNIEPVHIGSAPIEPLQGASTPVPRASSKDVKEKPSDGDPECQRGSGAGGCPVHIG